MKIRTAKFIVKEGALNTYKNKLMSLASVSIVTASLLIFGIFLMIVVNLDQNTNTLEQLPQMQAYCNQELDDSQIIQIEQDILKNEKIWEIKRVTKEEAFEKLKQSFSYDKSVFEGLDNSFLPISFIVKLKNPSDSIEVKKELEAINGIESVECPQKTIELISKVAYWIKLVCSLLIIILLLISIFIIANTIKLTVFARRKEINIMKYIGATDWFIRWPFVVEGVIIGIIGAGIAFLMIYYGYVTFENRFNGDLMNISKGFIRFAKFGEIGLLLAFIFVVLGGVVGALGSIISLRKYLRV